MTGVQTCALPICDFGGLDEQLAAGDQPSATNLASDIANSLVYKAQTQASLSVIKTSDETLGSLLDIKA